MQKNYAPGSVWIEFFTENSRVCGNSKAEFENENSWDFNEP